MYLLDFLISSVVEDSGALDGPITHAQVENVFGNESNHQPMDVNTYSQRYNNDRR